MARLILKVKLKMKVMLQLMLKVAVKVMCLLLFAGCAKIDDEWILDSAYAFHICIHKEWFSTYELVEDGGSMLMGDNTPRKIVGIGSIQIKMSDGIIRTLTDGRHSPTMMRNLISLSTL